MNRVAWAVLLVSPLLGACPAYDLAAVENTPPVVDAGESRQVSGGDTVTLSATGSDADGDSLTWSWRQTAGVGVVLSSATEREVTFVAPKENTVLVFEVRAHDGFEPSEPALVHVAVHYNRPPVADAGGLWTTPNGTSIRLRGNASDPDGDPIVAWQWTMVAGPPGADLDAVLIDADTRLPTFLPPVKGEYRVELSASDGDLFGAADEAVLIATNRPPVAEGTAVVSDTDPRVFVLDGTASWDPDGDDIALYRWEIVSVPASGGATFLGDPNDPVTTVEVAGSGSFELSLTVTDEDALESAPARIFLYANQAPVLALNGTEFVAASGQAFDLDASATVDPDGDDFFVTWTRIAGNAVFPEQQVGTRPILVAPAYRPLLEAGEPTWAVYEVVASDGSAASQPQTVTLYAGPSIDEAVVVSSRPEADDDGPCGSLEQPCATLDRALEILTGGETYGDGRLLLLTHGNFEAVRDGTFHWPADVDALGGLHPTRFVRSGTRTNLRLRNLLTECGIPNVSNGIRLPTGTPVRLEGLDVELIEFSCGYSRTFLCNGCQAELHDMRIALSGSSRVWTIYLIGGGQLDVSASEVRATLGGHETQAIRVQDANLTVMDSVLSASGNQSNYTTTAIDLRNSGSVVVDRSLLMTLGRSGTDGTGAALRIRGSLSMRNSVVHQSAPERPAVRVVGPATIINATLVASAPSMANWTLVSFGELRLANTILVGATGGLLLADPQGRSSRLYDNVIVTGGGSILRCSDGDGDFVSAPGPEDMEICNDTGTAWTGNGSGPCLFVDEAAGNFRLDAAVDNPCIDGGAAASPAGTAPDEDMDGNPRPAGTAHDIGAYEVQ